MLPAFKSIGGCYFFTAGSTQYEILITGIGMVNTAFTFGQYVALNKIDLAIHMGIGGAFTPVHPIGSAVEIVEEYFGELGAQDGDRFLSLQEMGFATWQSNGQAHHQPLKNPIPSTLNLPKVKGMTNQTVHARASDIEELLGRYAADIETMESAAFFQVCLALSIPFYSFRGISNLVGPRNKALWKMKEAQESVSEAVISTLRFY